MLVPHLFRRAAQAWPDRSFLYCDGTHYTYAQVWNQSVAVASWLAERRVRPGDRVILCGQHGAEYVATFVGTLLRGAVAVPLPRRLSDATLQALVRHAAPTAVAIDRSLVDKLTPTEAAVLQLRGRAPGSHESDIATLSGGLPNDSIGITPSDPAVLLYPGSSGNSPAIAFSHKNLIAAMVSVLAELAIHPSDRVRLTLPLHSPGGLAALLVHAAAGAQLDLAYDGAFSSHTHDPADEPSALWIDSDRLTAELDSRPRRQPLDYVACWGLLSEETHRRAAEAFGDAELVAVYYHPEAAGPVAFQCAAPESHDRIPCRLARGLQVLSDSSDDRLPAPSAGQLALSGLTVADWLWTSGKFHRRDNRITIRHGGTLNDDGTLYIHRDMPHLEPCRTSTVCPERLERAIQLIPAVAGAAVLAVDRGGTQELWAFVEPVDGTPLRPADIQQHPALKEHGVAVDTVIVMDELPRREGKIDHQRLLKELDGRAGEIDAGTKFPSHRSNTQDGD